MARAHICLTSLIAPKARLTVSHSLVPSPVWAATGTRRHWMVS
ncbi:UNVERIFIED_CONTAM: hypothetical protein GTU68_032540 [Idotea baltica]|nr:hypothetical protein [Idotea baltica]